MPILRAHLRLRRRDVLAGAACLAIAGPATRAQIPAPNTVRAVRLTRGLTTAHWFEKVPGDPAALRRHVDEKYQAEDFAAIRALGFNHVRVALEPAFLAPRLPAGDPSLDPGRLAMLDEAMARIVRSGLAIVLSNHMDAAAKDRCAADPAFRDAIADWWNHVAAHVADKVQYHVDGTFFELFNEPNAAFADAGLYRQTIEQFRVAVRRAAGAHTLIVGGNDWNSIDGLVRGLRTPLDDDNLIYAFHFYRPLAFTQQGLEAAGPAYAKLRNVPWDVDAGALAEEEIAGQDPDVQPLLREYNRRSHRRADLEGPFADMRRWCDEHGQIGWLGEFGVHNAAVQTRHRVAWIHHVRELAEQHKFGWNMAEARGAFGLFGPGEARPLRPDRPLLGALGL